MPRREEMLEAGLTQSSWPPAGSQHHSLPCSPPWRLTDPAGSAITHYLEGLYCSFKRAALFGVP